MHVFEAEVIPALTLKVGGHEYTVEFPLPAVIEAEKKTGRSLKSFQEWWELPPQDIPAILEAGLSKHHPEANSEVIKLVCDQLNPEALNILRYALCKLAFPKVMERWEAARAKGHTSPNA